MSALPPPAAADHAAVAPPAPRDGGAGFAAPAPPGREQIVVAHSGCGYGPAHRLSDNRRPAEDRTRGLVAWVLRSLAASRSRSEGWLSTGDLPGRYRSPGRIRGQQPPAGGDRLPDRGRTPAWAYGDGHRGGDLKAALARLSRGLRTAVVFCDVEGIPDGQVAVTRGVKPGAPRGRVHRAPHRPGYLRGAPAIPGRPAPRRDRNELAAAGVTTAARLAEPTRGRLLPARPRPGRGTGRAVRLRSRVPAVAGLLCLLTGLLDILGGLTPALHARMAELSPGVPASVGQVTTVVTGLVLVLLAGGLRRRRRRAYLLVCALLAASITGHLATGLDVQQATAAAVQLGLLGWFRDVFDARGDPRARWRGMAAFGLLLAASMAIGVAALNMPCMPLAGHYDLAAQARQVLFGLVGVAGPVHFTATGGAAQVADLLGDILVGLGLLTVLAPIYLVLRPAIPAASLDPAAETRLRTLLDRQGRRDSLGYFALRRDKILVWSPSGKAAIAYRAAGGVMLASGDPLGDPEAWAAAMTEFLRLAGEHGLTPAVIGCSEQAGAGWARHGLAVLELGDEAIVSVADFSLAGRGMRNVRQMVHRIERQGYTCQARRVRDIPAAERALLRARAAAWRGASTERGFSMALGRLADPADGDCVTVTAGRDGQLCAFLHFVPWGADGLSLDVMRRDRTADPGLNELLIVAALRAAPALGVTRVSLNFAMFRSALDRGQRLGAGPVLRLWRAALVFVSRWWQIESLYRFDAKFCPDWQPRYLCYPTGRDLPRVAVAALRAEAFLDWSWPRLYRRGRRHSANPQSPAAPCCADTGVALRAADADADDERQPAGAAAPT